MVQEFHLRKMASSRANSGEEAGSKRLQRSTNIIGVDSVVLPELRDVAADKAAIAEIYQALEHGQRRRRGDRRQFGLACGNIDRRTGEDELAHLPREPRGIDQGQPAALAEPDEISQTADFIDQDIEVGKVVINTEKSHIGAGRAPIGHEQPLRSSAAQGGNETVPTGKIGDRASMQRKRSAQQGGNAGFDQGKVAEPDSIQFERDLA